MKKIFLSLTMLVLAGFGVGLKAQCDLAFNNLVIQSVGTPTPYPNSGGPKCKIVFNASFDITTNSGFKYLFFHSWRAADYPSPSIFNCSGSTPSADPGTAAQLGVAVDDLGKSFLDIGFIGMKDALALVDTGVSTNVTSLIAATYPHDGTVTTINPTTSPGLTAFVTKHTVGPNHILHFDVQNITIIINQICGTTLQVKTDIWGSNQNAADPKAQCYICGLSQVFNDPTITGFKTCSFGDRQYAFGVTTVVTTPTLVNINTYIDMDGSNTVSVGDIQVASVTNFSLSSTTPYSTGSPVDYLPYSATPFTAEKNLIIQVDGAGLANSISKVLAQPVGCIGLPVDFKSFTAVRTSHTNVALKWETMTELNVSGFSIERNTNGSWQEVAFVPTQAPNGTSTGGLDYTFNDANALKGMSQYRIKEVDLDSKFRYSIIRAVRGDGQSGEVVLYPNPTSNGKATLVFEDGTITRDVVLIDMTGRMIKQWKAVTNNNIQIDNLTPGVYTLRIVATETGEQTVQKLVVSKR